MTMNGLKMFRLMCFNVFAHNRDDYSNNFSFIYDEENHKWICSPAYDLTFSSSIGGEHATSVAGNGSNPGLEDILKVAKEAGISASEAKSIVMEIREKTMEPVNKY